ncbi:MAG: adventurous gliding motility protein AgmC [Hyalangium sp.]|uniref:adventurous gliding motility protein AgmC n=1 Tax=Hyalangium sp. TaxID=2028555 RepID=UPI00389A67C3
MRCLGVLLSLGLGLAATPALAEADVFELGNGQHGVLRVQQLGTSVNTSTALTAPAAAGGKALTVADVTGFAAGELVLVLQVYASGPAPSSGTPGPLDLSSVDAGRWELARLESVAPGLLTLTAPLVSAFSSPGAQVVRVPEYTRVQILSSSSLVAPPWNGSSGGVLAFLSQDMVLNAGLISADGAGFRGGAFLFNRGQITGCTELDQPEDLGGARKGEGLFAGAPGAPTHGYGALGNGAGGGNCDEGGGGGGGHGGAGGQGGFTRVEDGSRDVGGRGGLALHYSPLTRMMFGGGGGAGAGDSAGKEGNTGTSGAAGGGIIYIRARSLQGNQGIVRANGLSAGASISDASGGGGAGGHITVRVQDSVDCMSLEAQGGNGGDNADSQQPHAPGGGGGGGVVLVQGQRLSCPTAIGPGLAGTAAAAPGAASYGASPSDASQPESQGVMTSVNEGFASPSVPVWVSPAEGEATGPRPQLQGTAQAGSTVQVLLNDQFLGSAQADDSGSFTLTPSADLSVGPQQLRALADRLGVRSAPSDPRAFTVGPLSPVALDVGCGCGTSQPQGSFWLALGVLLLGVSRRRSGAVGAGRGVLAEQGRPGVHLHPVASPRLAEHHAPPQRPVG